MTDPFRDALYRAGVEQLRFEKWRAEQRLFAQRIMAGLHPETLSLLADCFEPTPDERRKVTH